MNNFIPIYEYAELNGVKVQTVYRWLREGKMKKEDFRIEDVVVKRIRINKEAKPTMLK